MAKTIQELRDERSHVVLTARDTLDRAEKEGRLMTADEQKHSDELMAQADTIDGEIEAIKANDERAAKIRGRAEDLNRPAQRVSKPADPAAAPRASAEIIPMPRYGSLKAFKKAEDAYACGMWLVRGFFPSENPNQRKAREFCNNNFSVEIRDALGENNPSTGGNLVPDQMAQTIIDLREDYGIMRQWCDVAPMSSDYQIIPRRSGSVTPYWVGEGVAATASNPTFDNVTLTAKKLAVYTLMSSELAEDAIINMVDWLAFDIAQQLAYEEDRVAFNGTGISTDGNITGLFKKILQAGSAGSYIDVATNTHNLASEIDNADLVGLMAKCPQYARQGAAFFCSQEYADAIFGRLKAIAGGNTVDTLAMAGITALGQKGIVGSYLGYPIVASQVLPTGTVTSNPLLAFGNMSKAVTLGERRQIRFATDSSIKFAEDQIAIKATARLDINVHDLGTASVAGPVVVLKASS